MFGEPPAAGIVMSIGMMGLATVLGVTGPMSLTVLSLALVGVGAGFLLRVITTPPQRNRSTIVAEVQVFHAAAEAVTESGDGEGGAS